MNLSLKALLIGVPSQAKPEYENQTEVAGCQTHFVCVVYKDNNGDTV